MSPSFSFQGEKTRQELLDEIIAKSKERKLEKARGKEEQESERERLDEGIGELLGMLSQRPTKGAGKPQSDDYDLTMRVRESILTFLSFNNLRERMRLPHQCLISDSSPCTRRIGYISHSILLIAIPSAGYLLHKS